VRTCAACSIYAPDTESICPKCGKALDFETAGAPMPNARKSANQQLSESVGYVVGFVILGGLAWLLSFIFPAWMVIAFVVLIILGVAASASTDPVKAKQDAQIFCPQCQRRGSVRTQSVTLKKGISGTKATGAILTGGISLLAVGLSRKEDVTEARCSNCGSVWHF
jgi:hypothetical protein